MMKMMTIIRIRDGMTNFILRIKVQEKRLTLQEHDDDDNMIMMMIRGRDGRTNFIMRIKERETRLTLQEHHDDDEDDDPRKRRRDQIHLEYPGTGNTPYSSGI